MLPIPSPSGEELAEVRARHAHRFPQSATLTIPSPSGTVSFPIVLGLPSGACPAQPGVPVSPAWGEFVKNTLTGKTEGAGFRDLFVQDAVLYPPPPALMSLLEEWPALYAPLNGAVLRKAGADAMTQPLPGEKVPDDVAALLQAHPRAIWRKVRLGKGQVRALVLGPVGASLWGVLSDALRAPETNHWQLACDTVRACILSSPSEFEDTIARLPLVAIALMAEIANMAGGAAAVELGE